jgi:hypothetical protein
MHVHLKPGVHHTDAVRQTIQNMITTEMPQVREMTIQIEVASSHVFGQ